MYFQTTITLVVVAVLTLLIVTSNRHAAVENDVWVLEYSPLWRGLVKALWLFPMAIAVIAIVSPPNKGEGWIVFAIIFGFTAINLPLSLEVSRRRIELAENHITQHSAWSKPVTIAWQDVREVVWKLSDEIHLRSKRGAVVNISRYLSGMATAADEFEQRMPHVPGIDKIVERMRRSHV